MAATRVRRPHWKPMTETDPAALLQRLERAIAERGGQRRARPYVASQLRRLRRARPA